MKDELKNAIDLIEQAGGIVIMQDPDEDFSLYDHEDMIAKEAEEKAELERWQQQRQESLNDMKKDFDQMLGSKNFSVSAVEDMVHGHGFDLDDLEDLIHNYY